MNAIKLLPKHFYARDASLVARDLLGKIISHGPVSLRITETEAYCWPDDSASHAFKGRTPRSEIMWGPPGRTYVYLCYGLHNMLNIVTNKENEAGAVLIRAAEPLDGNDLILERRGQTKISSDLLVGPGKVAKALNLDRSFCHHPLYEGLALSVFDNMPVESILVGPRIGISYAALKDQQAPLRFADGKSQAVAKKAELSFYY